MHRLRQGEKLTRQTLPIIRSVQFRKSKSDILEKCGGLDFWLPKQTDESSQHTFRALEQPANPTRGSSSCQYMPVHNSYNFKELIGVSLYTRSALKH